MSDHEIASVDVRDQILKKLKDEDRSLRWLAHKCEVNYSTFYSCIVRKLFKVTEANLIKINLFLKTDFKED